MIRFTEKDFYRFLCNFEATDDCWMWRGNLRGGYGYFCVTLDKAQYVMKAHRASYYLFNGEVGDLFVCHRCDTPACVNPAHLFLGTNQDNILDASVKGRLYKGGAYTPWKRALTHCKRGHPLSGDNLSAYRKRRVCLACMRLKGDESRERKRRAKAIQQEAREA